MRPLEPLEDLSLVEERKEQSRETWIQEHAESLSMYDYNYIFDLTGLDESEIQDKIYSYWEEQYDRSASSSKLEEEPTSDDDYYYI
jgi:hypothetical protein